MKNLAIVCSAFYVFSMSADLWAQTRGSNYNPPSRSGGSSSSGSSGSRSGGSSSSSSPSRSSSSSSSSPSRSSSSSSSSSPSRGSSYNPPSRSSGSSSSSSSSSPSRGSNYNPPSSSGSSSSGSSSSSSSPSRGSNYNPPSSSGSSSSSSTPSSSGSSSSSSTTTGPRYNPPSSSTGSTSTGSVSTSPRGPRYNPPGTTTNPGTVHVPRGPRYNPPGSHTPVNPPIRGPRYNNPRDYYTQIPHHYVYIHWVQYPVDYYYYNGYWDIDGYPYYVNHGYRYRYSPVDYCKYELVDASTNTAVRTYPVQACSIAYDQCAVERDSMNRSIGLEQYFCAEAVDSDLAATDPTEYQGTTVVMTEARSAAIRSYLSGMDYKDIFSDAMNYGVNNCSIVKVGGLFGNRSPFGCKYQVNVSNKAYPAVDGSVCSDAVAAEKVDCNVGNEKQNAGCIMKQAIESGLCH